MNIQYIKSRKETIAALIADKRLGSAFYTLESLAIDCQAPSRVHDSLRQLSTNYRLMADNALDGRVDPLRVNFYDDIANDVLQLTDSLLRNGLASETSSLYFGILRVQRLQPCTFDSLDEDYSQLSVKITSALMQGAGKEYIELLKERDELAKKIFNRVWVSFPLSASACERIGSMITNTNYPDGFSLQLVSALTLGALEYYDDRRMALLAELYTLTDASEEIRLSALTGLLLGLWVHRQRPAGKSLRQRLALLPDSPAWHEDVVNVYLQFLRARDTERISRKMTEEVIPEMLKLRPDIKKKMRDMNADMRPEELMENPEWEELFSKSGLQDKLKEMSELQEDGGDVMMSTFSSLKSFPFFNDIANWFLPFDPEHHIFLTDGSEDHAPFLEVLKAAPFLCDGDKYSMALSLARIPAAQRGMMLEQFKMQNLNMAELRSTELIPEKKKRENFVNKYVQGLYRFFRLFRRKGEFADPFATSLNLFQVDFLRKTLRDVDTMTLVGEFFLKRRYFADALDVLEELSSMLPPSAQLFQKIGLCYQQQNDIANALKYYEQSELLNAESLWTLRRIANCHRTLDQPAKALEYYERIAVKRPDDLSIALAMGHCLLELGRYNEALKQYFKVEFLDSNPTRAQRPIAWCALLSGDYARSRDYYNRILADKPDATDFLNAGHLELIQGNFREAVGRYTESIHAADNHIDRFTEEFTDDRPTLERAGADPFMISVVMDSAIAASVSTDNKTII